MINPTHGKKLYLEAAKTIYHSSLFSSVRSIGVIPPNNVSFGTYSMPVACYLIQEKNTHRMCNRLILHPRLLLFSEVQSVVLHAY